MLKVGDFSRIAQVSSRLLRYYDEMGLFHPAHIDPTTGYRFYRVEQIPDLNRILALRDLGLSLEQIKRCIVDDLSTAEIRGMLALKKAQVEQQLTEELNRLRRIEHRLQQLEQSAAPSQDVVIKPVPAQHILSTRESALPAQDLGDYLGRVLGAVAAHSDGLPGHLVLIEHSEAFPDSVFDLETGFAIEEPSLTSLAIAADLTLHGRLLPAVEQMATVVHVGPWGSGLQAYYGLGQWIEANGYEFAGPIREVYFQLSGAHQPNNVVEFQLPIRTQQRS